jgi:hypothetical protein
MERGFSLIPSMLILLFFSSFFLDIKMFVGGHVGN